MRPGASRPETPHRILVPAAPKREYGPAVAYAAALACALDAELLLLGVVPLRALGPFMATPEPDGIVAPEPGEDPVMRHLLERTRRRLGRAVRSRTVMGVGPAEPAILDAAETEHADMIVLPRLQGGSLAHPFHAARARHIAEHAGVPVLLVPSPG